MRVIQFETDFVDVTDNKELKAHVDYIVLRGDIGHYSGACDGYLSVGKYEISKAFDPAMDWNGKKILIHRSGFSRDLFLIKPLLYALKKKWPQCHLVLHCEERYSWRLSHNPYLDVFLSSPLTRETIERYDAEIDLEGTSDTNSRARNEIVVRAYASVTGIEPTPEHTIFAPSIGEVQNAHAPQMRLIRFDSDVVDAKEGKLFRARTDYVIPREVVAYYSHLCDGFLSLEKYENKRRFDQRLDWNGRRILIHRSGSAGDLLFITPLLRELKQRWPDCRIFFNCEAKYHWVFENNPHVDQVWAPPLELETIEHFDAQIDLEGASEYSALAKTHVLVDVYASEAGLSLSDKKTLYSPTASVVEKVNARFPKTTKRVGLSLFSDGVLRNYPQNLCLEVVAALMRANIQVVLLGKKATGVKRQPLFIDLPGEEPILSWKESTAFMKTCDLVLGPDSSAIHFAGAMGVPSLGLFGPFPADLRIPTQIATEAIQATGVCAPCFHHGRGNVPFPAYGPCALTGQCEVLASIPPQEVVTRILTMIGAAA